ncbi:MAG: sugar ABC transporter ATP-binding protein [Sphaerochaeta sp.]|jgi:methyl-galactoside transport system ATP-binding protein|nr:sugar ABC transporter ATP-binding protein [Sphaerochaeta sp.]
MMNAGEYLLEMKNVSKRFPGVQALKDVQVNVKPGEVLALMGENGAGKSTLMKCLFGIYKMDQGEIFMNGNPVVIDNPRQALDIGIAMVQQELEQVPHRNVMDNIWLGRYPRKGLLIDDKKMYKDTLQIIELFNMNIDPRAQVNHLSVSTKQMADIVKAVSYNAKIIVLDEPTSSLTEKETVGLFKIIRQLKQEGCGIIYISHKIEEVMNISDRVTVLRDGLWVATENTKDIDSNQLIKLMVNRELGNRFPPKNKVIGETILKVENLSSVYSPRLQDISFEVRAGEILGIGGLVGAGRTELLECIFGLRTVAEGAVFVHGKDVLKSNRNAKYSGIAMVTEERRETGIFPMMDIRWNTVSSSMEKNRTKAGFISLKKVEKNTQWAVDAMRIKTPTLKTLISSLSGGNQQKVLLGRCLLNQPRILLLDEPTRGIDVGAKYEIYQLMIALAKEGKAVVFVSSEMPELLGVADRILVMSNGRNAGIMDSQDCSQEKIMTLAAKYL